MKSIFIVGATSAIATACARRWAAEGAQFVLAARDSGRLATLAADLEVRGAARVTSLPLDIADPAALETLVADAFAALGRVDVALIAYGSLPDQGECQASAALSAREFHANAGSVVALLAPLGDAMEAQKSGHVAVITSVAGDRGRPSNYVYGAAKAALQAACEGLRARLAKVGVSVTDIRPGFVASPMTAGLPLPGPLVAQPGAIAPRLVKAIEGGRAVVYAPFFWRPIMFAIRSIPRVVFNRLSL